MQCLMGWKIIKSSKESGWTVMDGESSGRHGSKDATRPLIGAEPPAG